MSSAYTKTTKGKTENEQKRKETVPEICGMAAGSRLVAHLFSDQARPTIGPTKAMTNQSENFREKENQNSPNHIQRTYQQSVQVGFGAGQ